MDNNELLKKICNSLSIGSAELCEIMTLSDSDLVPKNPAGLLASSDDAEAVECSDAMLSIFLDALIQHERGGDAPAAVNPGTLSNNQILKKLRIAMNFQEADMVLIFEEGGAELSRSEINALFRKQDNKHFRICSDAVLQCFLAGLSPTHID